MTYFATGTMVLQSSFKTSPEQVRKMKDDIKALKVENTSLKLLTVSVHFYSSFYLIATNINRFLE